MAENKGRVLYNNVLRDYSSISYSGTGVAEKGPVNAVDWRDFSLFEVDASSTTILDFTIQTTSVIDAVSLYVTNYTGTGSNSIELQCESSASVFTSLVTTSSAGGKLTFDTFSEVTITAGLRIRFIFTTGTESLNIRQLVVGKHLEFNRGQWSGVTPPNFTSGNVSENIISVNGSIIARNNRYLERSATIDMNYLNNAWMRTYWEPFQLHATKYPFIYQWSPSEFPNEVAFAAASKVNPPVQDSINFMSVSMPLRCLIADTNVL